MHTIKRRKAWSGPIRCPGIAAVGKVVNRLSASSEAGNYEDLPCPLEDPQAGNPPTRFGPPTRSLPASPIWPFPVTPLQILLKVRFVEFLSTRLGSGIITDNYPGILRPEFLIALIELGAHVWAVKARLVASHVLGNSVDIGSVYVLERVY
ncbi:hypothetical protein BDV93DRAFT_507353 [Ceratobasidium sp. AG-I]|nr:hypothetical protein BDV93DRAFT_507353 [Ceratobasidium sp. AG-I]